MPPTTEDWPLLPYAAWRETRDTLHMYTQVLGKLRLALSPPEPQWAHVALYVTARGLTTSTIPVGRGTVDAELDLLDHVLVVRSSDGKVERCSLGGSVAVFYADVVRALAALHVDVSLSLLPSEVSNPIPFPDDTVHSVYSPADAERFFRVLSVVDAIFRVHHGQFRGRTSPVHFFWGSFDLALARFSGRAVTPPPGADFLTRTGGDAEEICAGWWPGDERIRNAAFYAYAYPRTEGVERIAIAPAAAAWNVDAGEFLLPHDALRSSPHPGGAVLEFLRSTYAGAAAVLRWDDTELMGGAAVAESASRQPDRRELHGSDVRTSR